MADDVNPLLHGARLQRLQRLLDETAVADHVARYLIMVVRATREQPGVELGASTRAAVHLLAAAKANARLEGRDAVGRPDVERVAPYVLAHRMIVPAGRGEDVVRAALATA